MIKFFKARNFSHFRSISRVMDQNGFAFLEAAISLAVLLPVALLIAILAGVVHDQNVLRSVPGQILSEYSPMPLKADVTADAVNFTVNTSELASRIDRLSRAARDTVVDRVHLMTDISVLACYWVLRVDSRSGRSSGRISEGCVTQGSPEAGMSLEPELHVMTKDGVGLPLYSGDTNGGEPNRDSYGGYLDRAVLFGVKVTGKIPEAAKISSVSRAEFGEVAFARREVTL